MRGALALVLVLAGCGGATTRLDAKLPEHLGKAPRVLVKLESGGVIDWQKQRDEAVVERLMECLPTALAPVCPGLCEVSTEDDLEPHVVLTVKTAYKASAHFMHGFRLEVVYEIWDRYGNERLARYVYVDEPESKVMAEEGADRDEVLTYEAALTADRLCDHVLQDAGDLAARGK